MKKTLFFLSVFGFLQLHAQEVEENFDSYSAGDYVGTSSPVIEAWSGVDGGADDIILTDTLSHSAPNSMELYSTNIAMGGPGDVFMPLGYSDEAFNVSFYMYVAPGTGGYFNIQTSATIGIGWAYDVFFGSDGSIIYSIDQVDQGTGTYTNGAWIYVENKIDLVNDEAVISIDGEDQITLPFASDLGGVNWYALGNNEIGHYFIDDIEVNVFTPNSITETSALEPSIFPMPASNVFNISNLPLNTEYVILDLLGKEINNGEVTNSSVQIRTTEWERGIYFIKFFNGNRETTRKIIIE